MILDTDELSKEPKKALKAAKDIIFDVMLEIDCPLCDGEGETCMHTAYTDIIESLNSLITKFN